MKPIYLTFLSVALGACKKDPAPAAYTPYPFVLALLDKQGVNLLTSMSTPIQVYAFNNAGQKLNLSSECANGECTMVREAHTVNNQSLKYKFDYQTNGINSGSLNGIKTWYIELGGKTDTLFYDVQYLQPNDPTGGFELKKVTFNGKSVAIDQDQLPVYPLQRRY